MKEELEKIITQIIHWYTTDEPMITEEEGIQAILTLFNKRIDDSKEEIISNIFNSLGWNKSMLNGAEYYKKSQVIAQDIINIIKKEVGK